VGSSIDRHLSTTHSLTLLGGDTAIPGYRHNRSREETAGHPHLLSLISNRRCNDQLGELSMRFSQLVNSARAMQRREAAPAVTLSCWMLQVIGLTASSCDPRLPEGTNWRRFLQHCSRLCFSLFLGDLTFRRVYGNRFGTSDRHGRDDPP